MSLILRRHEAFIMFNSNLLSFDAFHSISCLIAVSTTYHESIHLQMSSEPGPVQSFHQKSYLHSFYLPSLNSLNISSTFSCFAYLFLSFSLSWFTITIIWIHCKPKYKPEHHSKCRVTTNHIHCSNTADTIPQSVALTYRNLIEITQSDTKYQHSWNVMINECILKVLLFKTFERVTTYYFCSAEYQCK